MGMSTGGGNKGGVQSEINVTPLIDVLLVLLIIFLVVMPIMMKKETLTIPRKLDDNTEQVDQKNITFHVKLRVDQTVLFNDGQSSDDQTIQFAELMTMLGDNLKKIKPGSEKVVFIDFEDGVKWSDVVETMDRIRSFATDADKDEIKVALTVCDADKRTTAGCPKPQ